MSDRDAQYSASESKRDPLGIRSALVDDLQAQCAELKNALRIASDALLESDAKRRELETAAEVLGQRALNIDRRWMETFEKRAAREQEMVAEARADFVDALLGELKARGVDVDEWDSDEAPEIALADRFAGLEELRREARGEMTAWAADALNCHQAIRELLKFHPESPETGAELPPEAWTPDYRRAVEYAKRCLLAGGEGAEQVGDGKRERQTGETLNAELSDSRPI